MKRFLVRILLVVAMLQPTGCATRKQQSVYVAQNAPEDRPITVTPETRDKLHILMEPYVARARATYPSARDRFLAGLPPRHSFFAVTRLHDSKGYFEQVFIAVDQIRNGQITGRIWSDILTVQGFKKGQTYAFPERELIDWTITKPDGSEEGNFVGKFLDQYTKGRQ